jgi:hypothetical protein
MGYTQAPLFEVLPMPFTRSRRAFLAQSLLTGAVVCFGTGFARTGSAGIRPVRHDPSWLDVHDFAALRGRRVHLRSEDGRQFAGRVVDVENADRTHRGRRVEQFSVLVRTGLRDPLPQQLFEVAHPEFGATTLFMVPVVSRSRAVHYEAIVSRVV